MMWSTLLNQINYVGAAALFVIGLYMVLTQSNLIKKIIGINIMETAVCLFFVTVGFVREARVPIVSFSDPALLYVNPLPSALILTGIVVAVSITVYALSLVVGIHAAYGTIELDEILEIQAREHHD